ncbi:response regulator transcription factor [Segetibacter sp. 3557_3]|uniref:response regulator transcription factor n=1 Tax=Segetibacter sp. 3557_3 TaxID=2547429 RepID=UPI0010591FB1|nr:response regulator transcription factor [Segetibacter sp. 3557_3]TDH28931.1 response regulator transcription factor [Segetibacter sp. 3557_3]
MAYPIRLVIADDHEIFRDGLALMLSRQAGFSLEGQASDGIELIEVVEKTQPEVVITDIKMPRCDGIEATRHIIQKFPDLKIIALSMSDEEKQIVEMLEAGAKGYLLKNADKSEVIQAIQDVYLDKTYYCSQTSSKLAAMILKSSFNPFKKHKPVAFSDREIEIIKLICCQFTAQSIADQLYLSKRTVEGYRTRILEKMGVKNAVGVLIYALRHRLVSEVEISGVVS